MAASQQGQQAACHQQSHQRRQERSLLNLDPTGLYRHAATLTTNDLLDPTGLY